MRLCIIHAGMPKTGSTSIQESLFASTRLQGARYVHTGRANSATDLCSAFSRDPLSVKFNRMQGLSLDEIRIRDAESLAHLAGMLVPGEHETFIVSGEGLINLQEDEFRDLCDWLLKHVDQVRVVAYVRDAKGFLESGFQQSVKGGAARQLTLGRMWPHYRQAFEKFDRVLGREQVALWKFDPRSFPGRDVVQDFCQRLGVSLPEEDIVRRNESLSLEAVSLLYVFRQHKLQSSAKDITFGEFRQIKRLVRCVGELQGTALRFQARVLQPVFEVYRDDADWIEQRIGARVTELSDDPPGAIVGDADLQRPPATAVLWLARRIGQAITPAQAAEATTAQIADWMDALRQSLGTESARQRDGERGNQRLKRRLAREHQRQQRRDLRQRMSPQAELVDTD